MFNWIKNLSKAKPKEPVDPGRQTRVVKRILPASLRQAVEEAELEEEKQRATTAALEQRQSPTITLTPGAPKAQQTISLPKEESGPEISELTRKPPAPVQFPVDPPVVEESEAPPPMVRLTSGRKNPTINFNSSPATGAYPASSGVSDKREIVLTISDFVGRIPPGFLNEKSIPGTQEVRFDAADLYSDMSKGKATVPLSIIAEVLPALFKRRLSPEEDIEIQLPLPKIVAQMSDLLTRPDQEAPEVFEEVETPFLKAAQRDKEIHQVSGAVNVPSPAVVQTPEVAQPAPERPKPAGLRLTPLPGAQSTATPITKSETPGSVPERRVTIRVRPLIQAMPIQQREELLGSIPEDSEVDLPLSEIESQLATGRVSLSVDTFSAGMKPAVRALFKANYTGTEVSISLPEIVKNLPRKSLQRREDQQVQEVDENEFETPFNKTPDTIASKPPAPAPAPSAPAPVAPAPAPAPVAPAPAGPSRAKPMITPAISNYTTRRLNSTGNKFPSPMHAALNTQDPLDAKKVVKLASTLPGVASLSIITEDGLSLADNLPTFMDPEGFSAMAPQLHRKMAGHANDMKLGELKHLSLYTETHTVTIFTGKGMTIAVLHQNQADLGHGVKEKFIAIVDGLAKQYNPEPAAP